MCSVGPESGNAAFVGDPCLPTILPEAGYDDSEVYIEAASRQCGGGVCLVYHLAGNPRDTCVPAGDPSCVPTESQPCGPVITCSPPQDIEERVYCSCRCDAPAGLPECECPDDFSCVTSLENGGPQVQGGYCVKNIVGVR